MATTITYTGVDGGSFINILVGPANGVDVDAASVGLGLQGAANNFKWGNDHYVNGVDDGGSYDGNITFSNLAELTVNGQTVIEYAGTALRVIGNSYFDGDGHFVGTITCEEDIQADLRLIAPVFEYKTTQSFVRTNDGTPFCSDHPNSIGGWINQRLEGVAPFNAWETTNAQPCVTQGQTLIVPVHLQNGQTLTKIRVYVKGGPAHAALPANLIKATLYASTVGASAAATVLATLADPSASTAAYQVDHSFYITPGSPYVIDRVNEVYELTIVSEWGPVNVVAGAYFLGAKAFYDTDNVCTE